MTNSPTTPPPSLAEMARRLRAVLFDIASEKSFETIQSVADDLERLATTHDAQLNAIQNWRLSADLTPGQDKALAVLASRKPLDTAHQPSSDPQHQTFVQALRKSWDALPICAKCRGPSLIVEGLIAEIEEQDRAAPAAALPSREEVERLLDELCYSYMASVNRSQSAPLVRLQKARADLLAAFDALREWADVRTP